jgi:hypothetical protein
MQVKTPLAEQRNSTRFNVGENVYALLKQPQYHELGKVIDISETGISFLCLNEGDWADEPFSIDIISSEERQESGNMMTISGLPLRPISYCRDGKQDSSAVNLSNAFKRCGVAFDQLNDQQKFMLDAFIARHATDRA